MEAIDYVLPSDKLLRHIPDFPYLDRVPGMPKLRHIGKKLSSGSADFNPSERVDLRYLRLARFGYSQGSSSGQSAKPVVYWTVRRGHRFGYVASIGLPFDAPTLAQGRPITSHQSPIRRASLACVELVEILRVGLPVRHSLGGVGSPSLLTLHQSLPLSLLTNHFSLLKAALAAQWLPGSLPPIVSSINLGLLTVATPFRIARDLNKIGDSRFEIIRIRISHCGHRVLFSALRMPVAGNRSLMPWTQDIVDVRKDYRRQTATRQSRFVPDPEPVISNASPALSAPSKQKGKPANHVGRDAQRLFRHKRYTVPRILLMSYLVWAALFNRALICD